MEARPNPFRDPHSPGRPVMGDGVDPRPCHVLPLKGWDQINVSSTIGSFRYLQSWGTAAPRRRHLHGEVTTKGLQASRD